MLSGCREVGFHAVAPISHREIVAWSTLYRIRPTPSEVKVLRDLDNAFLAHHSKKTTTKVDSSRPMTPELFDGMFK